MASFEKKIKKIIGRAENALVIGDGFGMLQDIVSLHNTTFIIEAEDRSLKSKKLIYRENFDYIETLYEIKAIYFNLDKIDRLEKLNNFWTRFKSVVIVEGNSIVDKKTMKALYNTGWVCTSVDKKFHVWEKRK